MHEDLPEPLDLFKEVFDELSADPSPYVVAGLGQFLITMPALLMLFMVLYFGIGTWLLSSFLIFGAGVALGVQLLGESLGIIAGSLVFGLWILLGVVLLTALVIGVGAVLAPLNASLVRRIVAHQQGGQKLEFNAAFTHLTQDIVPVMLVSVAVSSAVLVGLFFFYIPGLIAAVLLGHASYLVILQRYSVGRALQTSVHSVQSHGNYYAMFWLLYFVCAMIASYIPIIGPMYLAAVHLRSHAALFGEVQDLTCDTPLLADQASTRVGQ